MDREVIKGHLLVVKVEVSSSRGRMEVVSKPRRRLHESWMIWRLTGDGCFVIWPEEEEQVERRTNGI